MLTRGKQRVKIRTTKQLDPEIDRYLVTDGVILFFIKNVFGEIVACDKRRPFVRRDLGEDLVQSMPNAFLRYSDEDLQDPFWILSIDIRVDFRILLEDIAE